MALELEDLLKMITTGALAAPAEEVEEFFVRNRSAALTQIIDLALLDNDVVATVVGETDCLFRIGLLLRDMASSYRDDWATVPVQGGVWPFGSLLVRLFSSWNLA